MSARLNVDTARHLETAIMLLDGFELRFESDAFQLFARMVDAEKLALSDPFAGLGSVYLTDQCFQRCFPCTVAMTARNHGERTYEFRHDQMHNHEPMTKDERSAFMSFYGAHDFLGVIPTKYGQSGTMLVTNDGKRSFVEYSNSSVFCIPPELAGQDKRGVWVEFPQEPNED